MPAMPTLRWETTVDASIDQVFAWHERPGALQRLLPPWEPIRVRSIPPASDSASLLAPGSRVELELTLPIPMRPRWVAEHTEYEPPIHFRDIARSGPFRHWEHRHRFEPTADGTRVIDELDYELPLGRFGQLADRAVRARLHRVFTYRHSQLAADLAAHTRAAAAGCGKLRVAIAGAGGLIGSALSAFLSAGGHDVVHLVRRPPRHAQEIFWDPARGVLDPADLAEVNAVVHLAGASIAGRWTRTRKRAMRSSRIAGTTLLAQALATLGAARNDKPATLICGSAIGYYGAQRGDELLTGASGPGEGFLADVVTEWERATQAARTAGLRVVHVRTGVVQSPAGGALRAQLPLFRLGAGGRIGHGRQWVSWVGIDDAVGLLHHALTTPSISGAMNATAPEPVRNRDYAATLARVLGRPAFLPLPRWAAQLALTSAAADEMLMASQRVKPQLALETGYIFRHPQLQLALQHLLGR